MARLKKEEVQIETPVVAEIIETIEETPVVETVQSSDAKIQFRNFIEAYAKANPAKYELKKEALLAKLNTL